jgi:chemotaxis protein histidine kinase CheA
VGKYTSLFIEETRRHLDSLGGILEALSRRPAGEELFFEGRRISHSIKGMALFEEQPAMAELAFAMEKGFERAHGGGAEGALLAGMREGVTLLGDMIGEVEHGGSAASDPGPVLALLGGPSRAEG